MPRGIIPAGSEALNDVIDRHPSAAPGCVLISLPKRDCSGDRVDAIGAPTTISSKGA